MEWLTVNMGWIIQTIVLGGTLVLTLGGLREKMSTLDKKVDKLETAVVQIARQDERILAMDQRVLYQGKRIDRLENVNARRKAQEDSEDN